MKQIVKPTRKEAKKERQKLTDCIFKSSIKPRFNAIERKLEWYFTYKDNNDVDELSKSTVKKLSEWEDKIISDILKTTKK